MRQILGMITVLYLGMSLFESSAQTYVLSPQTPITWDTLPLTPKIKESLKAEVYAKSEVKTFKNNSLQSLDMWVVGLHKSSCSRALVKISQYEKYKDFIGFIKSSHYDNKTKEIKLGMDHSLSLIHI